MGLPPSLIELSDDEKESDRIQVQRYLSLINEKLCGELLKSKEENLR